jgi:hypothetical protein
MHTTNKCTPRTNEHKQMTALGLSDSLLTRPGNFSLAALPFALT